MSKRTRNSPPSAIRPADAAARQVAGTATQQSELLVQEHSVTVQVQLPPPAMLEQYDRVKPGTSDLLIRWNEEEQIHRRQLEAMTVEANIRAQQHQSELATKQVEAQREALMYQAATVRSSDSRGQYLGWILCAAAIGGAIYLAMNGQAWVAGVLAALPTAAVIQSFRTLTRQEARESSKPGESRQK